MILFEYRRRAPAAVSASKAERRKAEWSARRERWWMASVYASSFVFIVLVTAQFIYAKSTSSLSPATEVTFTNGELRIPLAQVAGGELHRFAAHINGTVNGNGSGTGTGNDGKTVRFWLFQKPDGKIATVFDACEICGPVGFYRNSTGVICKNCAAPINPQSVGQPGGCNPIPLKATVAADTVIISQADLAAGSRFFQ
jgi:uncharacterized membrane protein